MKIHICSCCLLLTAYCVLSFSQDIQEYATSPRIGAEIDAYEREYFGLFPDIDGFKSAMIFQLSDGQWEFQIAMEYEGEEKDTTVIISYERAWALCDFIENYEDTLLTKPVPNGEKTKFATKNDTSYYGMILGILDTVLIAWGSSDPYNWRHVDSLALVFHYYDIDAIIIEKKGKSLEYALYGCWGMGLIGALIGYESGDDMIFSAEDKALYDGMFSSACGCCLAGTLGYLEGLDANYSIEGNYEKYKTAFPYLHRRAIYQTMLPPELNSLLLKEEEKDIKQ